MSKTRNKKKQKSTGVHVVNDSKSLRVAFERIAKGQVEELHVTRAFLRSAAANSMFIGQTVAVATGERVNVLDDPKYDYAILTTGQARERIIRERTGLSSADLESAANVLIIGTGSPAPVPDAIDSDPRVTHGPQQGTKPS